MSSALNDAKKLAKYNNELEQANVKLQYDYNRSLAQEDRSWQERMANSAHQREIADLKAAGLNPVLSVTGGNGAATPGGSATSVSKPNVDMSLPRAVMDMAIAQLNSATNLQMTAMNNANALTIAQGTWENNLDLKEATSGDSFTGQIRNLPDTGNKLASKINALFEKKYPTAKKAGKTYDTYLRAYAILYNELKAKYYSSGLNQNELNTMRKYERILKRNNVSEKYWTPYIRKDNGRGIATRRNRT